MRYDLLIYYCALILVASTVGGMLPVWFQLTHRGMQFAVSFVSGVMLGVGVLHMLPHAIADAVAQPADGSDPVMTAMLWLLAGIMVMFFMERFFCFHHHDVPDGDDEHAHSGEHDAHHHNAHEHAHDHAHGLSWGGAALGLAFHSVLNGVALAAAVDHGDHGTAVGLAGFSTFLVIVLHKPFDALTIGMLMARVKSTMTLRLVVNAVFSLAIPLGALLYFVGLEQGNTTTAYVLAFSAGNFLCISLSDLLPELQFHQHDRVKLSLALLAGLAVAYAAGRFEAATSGHKHTLPGSEPANVSRSAAQPEPPALLARFTSVR